MIKLFLILLPLTTFSFDHKEVISLISKDKLKTKAFVAIKDNKIVYENFFGSNKKKKFPLWSISKSVTSLIFGALEDRDLIRREDNISIYLKTKKNIQIKDLLFMASGIDWNEGYDKSPFNSSVVKMLYLERKKSISEFVLSKGPYKKKIFHYSSGDTNLINAVISKVVEGDELYPWTFLFSPMNISAVFERDLSKNFIGSSYVYMSAYDLIKLGKLIMNKGVYENKRVVSSRYINFMTTVNPYSKLKCGKKMSYGAHIWLNQLCEGKRPLEDAPEDTVAMLGYGGQSLIIIPSLKIIILRFAEDKSSLDLNKYISTVIQEIKL